MQKTFLEFVQTKLEQEVTPVTTKITLGDGNDFEPFVVGDDPGSKGYGKNRNLAVLIRAFKKGANWGWAKDEKSGEDKPVKMGSKKLFLTGGALRDHLAGKKPRHMELVCNASPDEIYHVLTQNQFQYVEKNAPTEQGPCFWIKKSDKQGRPFSFTVKIRGDEFELATFTKIEHTPQGRRLLPGTHQDDASSRDFTINAMYLALTNDNGPNKDLYDFYGGTHHLKSRQVSAIGNLHQKLTEDPIRALRLVRMLTRYGDASKISDEHRSAVQQAMEHLGKSNPGHIMDEFLKGLHYDDIDTRSYLHAHHNLGLLDMFFPGLNLDVNLPKELRELGDKHAPIAWMLRYHQPKEIQDNLSGGWGPEHLKKIVCLVKALHLQDDLDPAGLQDLMQSYLGSGISARKLKLWLTRLGQKPEGLVDAFLQHAHQPRVQILTPP